jgi:hypothetical protein
MYALTPLPTLKTLAEYHSPSKGVGNDRILNSLQERVSICQVVPAPPSWRGVLRNQRLDVETVAVSSGQHRTKLRLNF